MIHTLLLGKTLLETVHQNCRRLSNFLVETFVAVRSTCRHRDHPWPSDP
jgi:hypothetical protein